MYTLQQQIINCLQGMGKATADQLVRKMEDDNSALKQKPAIAEIHQKLSELDQSKQVKSFISDGELYFSLPPSE